MKKTITDKELQKKLEILNYEKSELLSHLKGAEDSLKLVKEGDYGNVRKGNWKRKDIRTKFGNETTNV